MKYLIIVLRIAFSLAIIYGIYTEAGIFTAAFALLVMIFCEITARYMEANNANVKFIIERLSK